MQALQDSYHTARVHQYEPGRKLGKKEHAKDLTTAGALDLLSGKMLKRWIDGRTFTRSMTQEWDLDSSSEGSMDTSDTSTSNLLNVSTEQ